MRVEKTVLAYMDGQLINPISRQIVANFSSTPEPHDVMGKVRTEAPALAKQIEKCIRDERRT